MVASDLGLTLIPNGAVHPGAVCRPLANRSDLVELLLVTRDGDEPLVREFIRTASVHTNRLS